MSAIIDNLLSFIPDKLFIQLKYFYKYNKFLNLKKPKTYDEKIQWLKLHDRNPLYTKLADKCEVKDIVSKIIGEKFIIPTLGVWDNFDDINFNLLPNKFVLKCTHDSGGIVICTNKDNFDKEKARKIIEDSLKTNYYYHSREWAYKDIEPRIIAEEYLDNDEKDLLDYKIHVFNGEPKLILVCSNRKSGKLTKDYFDVNWNHLDITKPGYPNSNVKIEKPEMLDELLRLSKLLAKGIPFVRTDFYIVKNSIYFGEMTFYPASGFDEFVPESWNETLGEWINIGK